MTRDHEGPPDVRVRLYDGGVYLVFDTGVVDGLGVARVELTYAQAMALAARVARLVTDRMTAVWTGQARGLG